jgi:hypothetical protein
MNKIIEFSVSIITTKLFWMLVITTFFASIMGDMRSTFKDQVFQEAVGSLRKRN